MPRTPDESGASAATWRLGRRLQWATVVWNLGEVLVTVGLGLLAGSLALIAFGLDSLVEVFASLVVIWHMAPGVGPPRGGRDRRALRLVALAFALLAAYLFAAGLRALAVRAEPAGSPVGIAYLTVTALVMFTLALWKRAVGAALDSAPFLAEASMTFLDGCLAATVLGALTLNLALDWWWADPAAALVVGGMAVHEAAQTWRGSPVPIAPVSPEP